MEDATHSIMDLAISEKRLGPIRKRPGNTREWKPLTYTVGIPYSPEWQSRRSPLSR